MKYKPCKILEDGKIITPPDFGDYSQAVAKIKRRILSPKERKQVDQLAASARETRELLIAHAINNAYTTEDWS